MNKITIFAIVFASLAGVGLLGNLITLSVQPLGIFGSLSELVGSKCSCNDGQGNFAPENCEQFGGVYDDPNQLCVTLQPIEGYYGDLSLEVQGCSASFWMDNSDEVKYLSVWPTGYSPDYYYNTMFQTSIQLSDLAKTVNEETDEKEQENSEVFGINEVASDVELPEETDEISSEETGEEGVVADEETGEEGVVADEETGEESVVADEETGEESVVSDEETGEESVVSDEETGEESVVADEETGEESVVADEETGEESVVAGEESVVAGEESVVADEETGEESVADEDQGSEDEFVENTALTNDQNTNGLTLIQALTLQDGKLNLLLRESVAAMLNAAHPDLKYPYTVPQIMTMTQIAIANENYDDTLNLLKTLNDKDNSPLCSASSALLTP